MCFVLRLKVSVHISGTHRPARRPNNGIARSTDFNLGRHTCIAFVILTFFDQTANPFWHLVSPPCSVWGCSGMSHARREGKQSANRGNMLVPGPMGGTEKYSASVAPRSANVDLSPRGTIPVNNFDHNRRGTHSRV